LTRGSTKPPLEEVRGAKKPSFKKKKDGKTRTRSTIRGGKGQIVIGEAGYNFKKRGVLEKSKGGRLIGSCKKKRPDARKREKTPLTEESVSLKKREKVTLSVSSSGRETIPGQTNSRKIPSKE